MKTPKTHTKIDLSMVQFCFYLACFIFLVVVSSLLCETSESVNAMKNDK